MITIKCAGNTPVELNEENLNIVTVGDVTGSAVVQQIFGVGDDMAASVNGQILDQDLFIEDGDVITLSSKGHGKGAATITVSSGGNTAQFSIDEVGNTVAALLASQLVQMTFGVGDDMAASVNGAQTTREFEVLDGDLVTLSSKGHGKGRV